MKSQPYSLLTSINFVIEALAGVLVVFTFCKKGISRKCVVISKDLHVEVVISVKDDLLRRDVSQFNTHISRFTI